MNLNDVPEFREALEKFVAAGAEVVARGGVLHNAGILPMHVDTFDEIGEAWSKARAFLKEETGEESDDE